MITTENLLSARFEQLEPELKEEILRIGTLKEVQPGDILLKSGQIINHTMLLLDGRLKIYREDEDGNEFLMYYLEPGNACAMSIMCAMNNERSQIMAVAETEASLLSIPFESTGEWLNKFRSWDEFVIKTYRSRFEELLNTLDNIAFRSMDERLLFYLKRLAETEGDILYISHQQIATDLNSAREVISRLLKKMEQRGAVELHRNEIRIKDLDFMTAV
ncbi:MAG TPA: Crp/Fnr family transcriptional regulator [Cryomorphaceae bacterium]|nr:Crp/Fnr family transcriptional regulator [Cryomorphaceae bacterium]